MPHSTWLEVSVTVNGEMAEAVSEIFSRFAPKGVAIEALGFELSSDGLIGIASGDMIVRAYLPVNDTTEVIRKKLEEALWYLGRIHEEIPDPTYRQLREEIWSEAWKKHYKPIRIGHKLIIVPSWMKNPEKNRIPIFLDPGMAFGTGTHPSTQICLQFIEDLLAPASSPSNTILKKVPECSEVIDIGCGSGILSIAALKLKASLAFGVDIDSIAVSVARENALLNSVEDVFHVKEGSLEDILAGKFPISIADLVLVNLTAPLINSMFDLGLPELVKQDGVLVLSGILDSQSGSIQSVIERSGMEVIEKRSDSDWIGICVRHPN